MSPAKLKVAFCNRPNWNNPLGGDGVQMLKTKEALEKNYDIEIDIITNPDQISDKYDIVHVFNFATTEITRRYIAKAKEKNLKVVGSSIFWDYKYGSDILPRFILKNRYGKVLSYANRLCGVFLSTLFHKPKVYSRRFKKEISWFIDNCDVILPNSAEEGELLLNWTHKQNSKSKIHIVINAVDRLNDNTIPKNELLQKYQIPSDYILQVGRIQTIKNQINLVYALRNHPEIPIVFIGKPVEPYYWNRLLKLSQKRGNVHFLPEIDHNLLNSFYAHARLHVLLSLRESPGLVTIEALANNCPVVTSTKEFLPRDTYFKDQPYQANPFDLKEIERIVLQAYKENIVGHFSIDDFSWDKASEQTFCSYQKVLTI